MTRRTELTLLLCAAGLLARISPAAALGQDEERGKDYQPAVARLDALIACVPGEPVPAGVSREAFTAHCAKLESTFDRRLHLYVEQGRELFAGLYPADLPRTVLYPFAGGDLAGALLTYPEAEEIVLLSSEPAGDPRLIDRALADPGPALDALEMIAGAALLWGDHKAGALAQAQRAGLPAALTLELMALAGHGFEPVGLHYFSLGLDGAATALSARDFAVLEAAEAAEAAEIAAHEPRGPGRRRAAAPPRPAALALARAFDNAEIRFRARNAGPGAPVFVMRHVSVDLQDAELESRPEVLAFLERRGRVAAMTKATERELWKPGYDRIRRYLLEHMALMVSDASGIPPALAERAGFEVAGYGHFIKSPVTASDEIDAGLRRVFSRAVTRPLPFRYGDLDADHHFNLLITRPRGSAPAPVEPPGAATAARRPNGAAARRPGVPVDVTAERVDVEDEVAGGHHWRLWTRHDAVHVWRPPRYRAASAGVVVYLHGYYVDVDRAWTEYALADQFRASGRNALFIVPEACIGDEEDPFWDDLASLLEATGKVTGLALPSGPVVVLAHSGGYRTVVPWLASATMRQIVLLDATYGHVRKFREWISKGPGPGPRQLVLTSSSTAERSAALANSLRGSVSQPRVPDDVRALDPRERRAPLIYLESQYEHMEMVSNGKVIPFVLELAPLADR